jgi:hypothetical protein
MIKIYRLQTVDQVYGAFFPEILLIALTEGLKNDNTKLSEKYKQIQSLRIKTEIPGYSLLHQKYLQE